MTLEVSIPATSLSDLLSANFGDLELTSDVKPLVVSLSVMGSAHASKLLQLFHWSVQASKHLVFVP